MLPAILAIGAGVGAVAINAWGTKRETKYENLQAQQDYARMDLKQQQAKNQRDMQARMGDLQIQSLSQAEADLRFQRQQADDSFYRNLEMLGFRRELQERQVDRHTGAQMGAAASSGVRGGTVQGMIEDDRERDMTTISQESGFQQQELSANLQAAHQGFESGMTNVRIGREEVGVRLQAADQEFDIINSMIDINRDSRKMESAYNTSQAWWGFAGDTLGMASRVGSMLGGLG